jgi:hypothetical protein
MTTIRQARSAYARQIPGGTDASLLESGHEATKPRSHQGGGLSFMSSCLRGRCWLGCLFAFCVVTLLAAQAGATTLVPADLGELARDAGAIIRGRVTATAVQWTGDRRSIETVVTIETEATLKGSLGPSVRFIVPGGTLGRYRRIFVGAPEFIEGQQVVVFLGWRGPSVPYLLGLGQGVFRIEPDRDGGSLVTPPPMVPPSSGTVRIVRGDSARRPMPLAEFEQRVRDLARVR